jgi:hypothetical protein
MVFLSYPTLTELISVEGCLRCKGTRTVDTEQGKKDCPDCEGVLRDSSDD